MFRDQSPIGQGWATTSQIGKTPGDIGEGVRATHDQHLSLEIHIETAENSQRGVTALGRVSSGRLPWVETWPLLLT